ncbi:hypothetical protein YC2023_069471 [Brassica napus]
MVTKGMRVGKYELGRTLGEGNSAKVKLATDTVSGQSFAVKIIDKSSIKRLNVSFQIKREIRTLKVLKHPNIVRLHEPLRWSVSTVFTVRGPPFCVSSSPPFAGLHLDLVYSSGC